MKIEWNELKNRRLKQTRGASFQEIMASELVTIKIHPKREHQNLMYYWYKNYIWTVPFVIKQDKVFLKTLYPNRKFTQKYLRGELR